MIHRPYATVTIGDAGKKDSDTFRTGDSKLISVVSALSMSQNSSHCSIAVNDPSFSIASKYLELGIDVTTIFDVTYKEDNVGTGSRSLPNINGSQGVPEAIIGEARRQGITDPTKIAFILAVAEGESSFNHKAYNNDPNASGGGAKYGGRGLSQITHDYNYRTYSQITGVDLINNPELAHRPDISTFILIHGMKRGWTGNGGIDKFITGNNPNVRAAYQNIQGGVWGSRYQKFFEKWKTRVGAVGASSISSSSSPSKGSTLVPKVTEVGYKGRKITIQYGFEGLPNKETLEYVHVGTSINHKGVITFLGQSFRWVLHREKRNRAFNNITIPELAKRIENDYQGLKFSFLDNDELSDDIITYLDQTNITDYQLLLRETKHRGYIIKEKDKKGNELVIKSPQKGAKQTELEFHVDITEFNVQDKAKHQLGQIKEGSKAYESIEDIENKTIVNLLQGTIEKAVSSLKEINKTPGTKGEVKDKPNVSQASTNKWLPYREELRRVKGLPTTFDCISNEKTLKLEPDDAILVSNMPTEHLNRAYYVDTVSHEYRLGSLRTTLEVFSPQTAKVIVANEPPNSSKKNKGGGSFLPSIGDWGTPLENPRPSIPGSARVEYGYARGRLHAGIDLVSANGNPAIYAVQAGVVTVSTSQKGGYGKWIEIKHGDGTLTRYAHNSSNLVKQRQVVKKGQQIAVIGSTGASSGVHLHFEIRPRGGQPVNPRSIIPGIQK